MADKPLNIPPHQGRTSAQGSPRPVVHVSFQAEPVALPASESIDVRGFSTVVAYNESGGPAIASAHAAPGDTPVALLTAETTVVSVPDDSAMPVSVVGVAYLQFSAAVTIIAAG